MPTKPKARVRKAARKRTATVKRTKRIAPKGVDMSDLVGSITITVDPLEYQRSIRNEW